MTSPVVASLSAMTIGEMARHHNLAMFPLFAADPAKAAYLTLDEALTDKVARVTEVSDAGHVPELAFENGADTPVLLVDGEELRGAKQNRILNITILVGPRQKLMIPVSCVERGRWHYARQDFQPGERILFAKARASKARQVSESMRTTGSARADQAQIWEDISVSFLMADESSPTEAMADLYASRASRLADYERALLWQPHQAGAVFAIDGKPIAIEVFDSADTFRRFLDKAIGSLALDALASPEPREAAPSLDDVKRFLDEIQAAAIERFTALGLGDDLRLSGERVAGGALAVAGKVIHLAAFAQDLSNSRSGGSEWPRRTGAALRDHR